MKTVRDSFREFDQVRSQIEFPIAKMKADLGRFTDGIVLYGAGSAGIAFLYILRDIGIEPKYFADGSEAKWSSLVEGVEVIAPQEIVRRTGDNTLVIVTINTDGKRYCKSFDEALRAGGHAEVHQKLREYGCRNLIDYTFFRRCHELFREDRYNLPSCSDVYLMSSHRNDIERVYRMLADDPSREVFLRILEFRLLDDSITVPTMTQEKQYFEDGFFANRPDGVFIDCGAFDGISLRTFLQETKHSFQGYYGFEPDESNFQKLSDYVAGLPKECRRKIKLSKAGVYSHDQGVNLYSLHGPGSFVADIGKDRIKTVTIDEALGEERATYIKMNIEGSEIEALKGAEQTIRRDKPQLAIAGYHKTWDFWEIPLMIKDYREDYELYLRSYMNHISFVYYAVS